MTGELETRAFSDISMATLGQALASDGVRVVVIYPPGVKPPQGRFEEQRIGLMAEHALHAAREFWGRQS